MLEGWDNFYVIVGSAAAGLMGLTFVVIALLSDARRANAGGTPGYITPTVIHFAAVLASCAFLSMPRQSVLSLSVAFAAGGLCGLIYTGVVVVHIRRFAKDYTPVGQDWLWHVMLPALVYIALFAGAVSLWRTPTQSMYFIAGSLLLLLFVGVHNAWDVAVSVALQKQKETKKNKKDAVA